MTIFGILYTFIGMDIKGLFINYVIFFWTITDPYPTLCHLVSSFDIPPPSPQPDDVIYERGNDY